MILTMWLPLLAIALWSGRVHSSYYSQYHCVGGRDAIVHLFEWKWTDVQKECDLLATYGYCAVQVSPANEHRVVTNPGYPWWQRYQPVSYKMSSRSGSEDQFKSMVSYCNSKGIRIYADVVINHMTGSGSGIGSAGSHFDAGKLTYPGVPYSHWDFHSHDVCHTHDLNIHNYHNPEEVRYCRLYNEGSPPDSGLRDLRSAKEYVREKIAAFMNKLIGWGVAGFRVDAAKHMFPRDLRALYGRLNNLNSRWFPAGTKPFIFQEVIDMGHEPIKNEHYSGLARVTEFKYGVNLGDCFRKNGNQKIAYLKNFGEGWGFIAGTSAVAFVDNHDNQRGHGAGGFGRILTAFEAKLYKMASAFMLGWQYGYPRVMSSYKWPRDIRDGKDINDWMGPPSNGGNTKDVRCFSEWFCEHRWRQIFNMVKFHNVAVGVPVRNWWDNGQHAIAFSRGNKAFIAINNENHTIKRNFNTGLPDGTYCDVISSDNNKPPCNGKSVTVSNGMAHIDIPPREDPMVAIHV